MDNGSSKKYSKYQLVLYGVFGFRDLLILMGSVKRKIYVPVSSVHFWHHYNDLYHSDWVNL